MWAEAADDGRQCIITDKSFVKGYFRAALGLQNMGNLDGAQDAIKRGLGIDSQNADLKKMSREIDEAIRIKKVDAFIAQAKIQKDDRDYAAAMKTIDSGLRLDPSNSTLNRMLEDVRPLHERTEKARLSNLDPKERIKEEGDNYFKAANFELAIKSYTKCIDSITNKVTYQAFSVTLILTLTCTVERAGVEMLQQ
jgi:tetratricopeptide (TPR) repeat protein